MKKIFLLVFLLFVCQLLSCSKHYVAKKPDIKGGFASCSVYHISIDSGKTEKRLRNVSKFDAQGYLIDDAGYDRYEGLQSRSSVKYDDNRNINEIAYYYPDGTLNYKIRWKYKNNGAIESMTGFDSKGNKTSEAVAENAVDGYNLKFYIDVKKSKMDYIYKFNEKGYLTAIESYSPDGTRKDEVLYTYDDNNNLIDKILRNKNGRIIYRYSYKYGSNGKKTEGSGFSTYDNSIYGLITTKYAYKYDNRGNEIEADEYNMDGSIAIRNISKYDNNNNRTVWEFYQHGKLNSKTVYTYDSFGNLVKENYFDSDGKPTGGLEYVYSK